MTTHTTDVLIVGAGPAGLTASLLLARSGVDHLVVEARDRLHTAPHAHVVTSRTLEILTGAGIPGARLHDAATPPDHAPAVRWVPTLTGPEHGHFVIDTPERTAKLRSATPTPTINIPQHRLEPVLFDAAVAAGAEIRFGHTWRRSSDPVDGWTTSSVIDRSAESEYEVRSRWVLACDGAASPVRRSHGIEMIGPDLVQAWINVHLAADLTAVAGRDPGLLYWCVGGPVAGVFVAHDPASEWAFMYPYDPERSDASSLTEPAVRALVAAAIGASVDFEIMSMSRWRVASQVAASLRSGDTFLLGDAAHRFPPTGGLGMNTGIADAHNLAWKIAAVVDGRAGVALLDTYESERRPVAVRNASQCLRNFVKMADIEAAIAMGSDVQGQIDEQADHFDMAGLDLGFGYESAAIVADGTPPPEVVNEVIDVPATARPGHRLPHAPIDQAGSTASTLDLVDPSGFVLLVGSDHSSWDDAPVLVIEVHGTDDTWTTVRGIADDGALLVRPDGHIAWRSPGALTDGATTVANTMSRILGK